jgi:hypothetical protein
LEVRAAIGSDGVALENACAPIRYRVLTELMDRPKDDPEVQKVRIEILEYPPGDEAAAHAAQGRHVGGTVTRATRESSKPRSKTALSLLFEMGWAVTRNRSSWGGRVALVLTAKKDLKFFEFGKLVKADEKRERYYRWFLRTLSLGLLVRGGYSDDRSRVAVLELLDLCSGFVDDPISRHPVEEIGASSPADPCGSVEARLTCSFRTPPDAGLRVLTVAARRRAGENAPEEDLRLRHVRHVPALAPDLGLVRTAKGSFVKGGGLRIGPWTTTKSTELWTSCWSTWSSSRGWGCSTVIPQFMAHLEWWHGSAGQRRPLEPSPAS